MALKIRQAFLPCTAAELQADLDDYKSRLQGFSYQVGSVLAPPKYPLTIQILSTGGTFEVIADDAPLDAPLPGFPVPKQASVPEKIDFLENMIQLWLDKVARNHGYDDIKSAATYAGDEDPTYAAEGLKFKQLRSRTWKQAAQKLSDYQNGLIPEPKWPQVRNQLETLRTNLGL